MLVFVFFLFSKIFILKNEAGGGGSGACVRLDVGFFRQLPHVRWGGIHAAVYQRSTVILQV